MTEHKRAWHSGVSVNGFIVEHGHQRIVDGEIKGYDNHIITLQSSPYPSTTIILSGENWEAFKAAINKEEK